MQTGNSLATNDNKPFRPYEVLKKIVDKNIQYFQFYYHFFNY